MSAYPFASSAKVTATLGVLGASNIATTQQTLLQQILVVCGAGGAAPSAPTTPTGFAATPGNQFTTLTWDVQSEADTFTINYGLTNDFGASTELTASATGAEFIHSSEEGIQAGERYYYWIQAVNEVGASDFTTLEVAARSFVTLAEATNENLVTPTGTWTIGTVFFRLGGFLPATCVVYWGAFGAVSNGDGTWDDDVMGGPLDPSTPISGSFDFTNASGASVTFWNTEP